MALWGLWVSINSRQWEPQTQLVVSALEPEAPYIYIYIYIWCHHGIRSPKAMIWMVFGDLIPEWYYLWSLWGRVHGLIQGSFTVGPV